MSRRVVDRTWETGRAIALSAIAMTVFVAPLAGQSVWAEPGRHQGASLEVLRPDFSRDLEEFFEEDVSFISSAVFLSGRVAVSPMWNVVAELPFAYGDLKNVDLDGHRASVGNPYLGVEFLPREGLAIEGGIRAPLADDDSFGTLVGLLTDFPARGEAFLLDYVPVTAAVTYDVRLDRDLTFRLRGGPTAWFGTEDDVDSELLAVYGGQLWYQVPRYSVGGGLIGRALLTESGSFDDRTIHQVGVAGHVVLGRMVPGVQLRVPLDKDSGVDFVAGFGLAVRVN